MQLMNDGEFEQMLLRSARGDTPPEDARDAWVRFSGTFGSMGATPGAGGHPTFAPSPSGPGGARTVAMKWLLWGVIAGSAATAAVMVRARPRETGATATVVVEDTKSAPPGTTTVVGRPAAPSPKVAPGVDRSAIVTTSLAALATHPRSASRGHARAPQELAAAGSSGSTLAAEVSRIDAARTANAAGDYDEAVWLIGRYHQDFPDGALAPDADVVALEAVAAKHDRPETARRAALFLSRYPGDPHATKVKRLAEHLGREQP
jgi:TolA-binding protein